MEPMEEIEALQQRVLRAESRRDTWRATGQQEKYEEAYFLVESLQSELNARLQQDDAQAHPAAPPT